MSDVRLRLTITDVMSYWDDSLGVYIADPDPTRRNTKTYWFRVPSDWIDLGGLLARRRNEIYAFLYGEDWLYVHDRAKYMVESVEAHVLDANEVADRTWYAAKQLYAVTPDGFVAVATDAF